MLMKYKFIACDYDDTLLPKSGVISDFTKDTIQGYIARGGRFAICTGRMFRSIVKIAREFGLHGEIISYQGSLIKNIDTEETLLVNDIDKDLAVDYVEFMKKQNVFPQVYVGDNLCVEKENPYSVDYARFCGVPLNVVGDFKDFFKTTDAPVNKVYCSMDSAITEQVRNAAIKEFGDRLLINSSKPYNVEAVDVHASKGKAVDFLANKYGISLSDTMTFGDNLNDLQMIEVAGMGVAVGNAVDTLKNAADYIAENCEDDGVAKTIRKFCF